MYYFCENLHLEYQFCRAQKKDVEIQEQRVMLVHIT